MKVQKLRAQTLFRWLRPFKLKPQNFFASWFNPAARQRLGCCAFETDPQSF
jgi:hypothetical protein